MLIIHNVLAVECVRAGGGGGGVKLLPNENNNLQMSLTFGQKLVNNQCGGVIMFLKQNKILIYIFNVTSIMYENIIG